MAKLVLNDITSGYASVDTLNSNFTAIETALENTLSRDGTTPNSMSADLDMNGYRILNELAYTGDGFIWEGAWLTATAYQINNLVQSNGNTYVCTTTHTSGAFATDLAAGKWELVAAKGADGGGSGNMVAANNLTDVGLTPAIALSNLGGQPSNAKLTAYTSTLTAANKIPYATDLNTTGELDLSTDTSLGTSDTTIPTQNAVKVYADTKNIATQVAPGADRNVLTSDGAGAWVSEAPTSYGITLGSPQTLSAASTATLTTGFSSTAKRYRISLDDVSASTNGQIYLQLGYSGGIVVTGYTGGAGSATATPSSLTSSTYIVLSPDSSMASTAALTGSLLLERVDTNRWVWSGTLYETGTEVMCITSGMVTLPGTLDRCKFTTTAGVFDGTRKVTISYE